MNSNKYCDTCNLPLFRFRIKHNGVDEHIYKCVSYHGTTRHSKNNIKPKDCRIKIGVKEHFKYLFDTSIRHGFMDDEYEYHQPVGTGIVDDPGFYDD